MYKYSQVNLLEKPEKYFYSKYQGVGFLKDYVSSREKILEFTKKFKNKNKDFLNISQWVKTFGETSGLRENNKLISQDFFKETLIIEDFSKNAERINVILKRFEVSKKVYEFYSLPEIKGSGNNSDPISYILFGLVLVQFYKLSKKLFYLNAIIKVCDILSSDIEIEGSGVIEGLNILINEELILIKGLINKENIEL